MRTLTEIADSARHEGTLLAGALLAENGNESINAVGLMKSAAYGDPIVVVAVDDSSVFDQEPCCFDVLDCVQGRISIGVGDVDVAA